MIVLVVGGSFTNKGAEAMLWTVIGELDRRLPHAKFVFGNRHVRFSDITRAEHAGLATLSPRSLPWRQRAFSVSREVLRRRSVRGILNERETISQVAALAEAVDVAVDISGLAYGDRAPAGLRGARRTLMLCDEMRSRGKPYVFLPQMWGPFENPRMARACRRSLRHASGFFARDETSRRHLADLLGIREEEIPLAADIAFLFEGKPVAQSSGAATEPVLGISPNMRVYERSGGEGADNRYVRLLVALSERFARDGARVRLIPHEVRVGKGSSRDDVALCELVARTAGVEVEVSDERCAGGLKRAIGGCEMLVGSRFHALIAALSQGVPAVAIGWAHKYPELLSAFGLEEFVFDHADAGPMEIIESVVRAWEDRSALAARVSEHLPAVRKSAADCVDEVARVLESCGRFAAPSAAPV